ncbi:Wilms tumor protein-like protein [Frankliniella fusca]|uniref:Wilms tumor protein-like protein n=1 Tax=Frankliniella fusca TaxID=407009 RepID=A0AAE1HIQ4_9NEOP|nr:Wilms tumor protein-like protein [Frankliniella fusca]
MLKTVDVTLSGQGDAPHLSLHPVQGQEVLNHVKKGVSKRYCVGRSIGLAAQEDSDSAMLIAHAPYWAQSAHPSWPPKRCPKCPILYNNFTYYRPVYSFCVQCITEVNSPSDEDDSLDEEIFQPIKKKSEKANSSVSSSEAVNYKCKVCSRVFSLRKNLLRHTRESHNNGIPSFKCLKCSGTFKREDKLKIHSKSCGHDSAKNEKRAKCDYPNCNLKFYFKSDLIKHLKLHHKQNIADPVEKNFDSIEEFQTWKDVKEERTFSYFSEQAGANKHDGRIYYYCQQGGSDKARRKISSPARKTSRKVKIEQIKTNKVCIAVMKVKIDPVNKSVQVIYFPSHSHPLRPSDFKYHPPTHAANNNINNQIALGVDPQIIHRNLQPSSLKRNNRQNGVVYSRDAVISKSAIKQRWAKVKNKKRLHKDDATSVYLTAKLLKSEEYNPGHHKENAARNVFSGECSKKRDTCNVSFSSVVVYKPVGLNVEIGPKDIDCLPNHKELFMFGIQSKEQKELLIEGSKTILVVDDTHNCTQYENFKLLNGLFVNENRRGWPVFHLITNKTDENTLKFFFQAIKEKCEGRLVVNCVITDDAPALINSIEMGFEEKIRHLLCCWHVQETFRRNLRSLSPISLNNVMLDELLLLMYTRKEEEFHQLLQGFKIKYKDSASTLRPMSQGSKNGQNASEIFRMEILTQLVISNLFTIASKRNT